MKFSSITRRAFKQRLLLCASAMLGLCLNTAQASWIGDVWDDGVNEIKTVYTKGDDQLFVSGHAHHGRSSYTPAKIATLNEHAWGLGWSKTLRERNASGTMEHRGVYGFVISDSHKDPQYMLGYSYEKAYYFNKDWFIAGGVTPMIVRREDMFGKIPFPAIFPLVSIGNQKAELRMVYIPRLSKNLGNGDVLYLFGAIKF
jgi:Antimicrobial peptide resistance and lipid A acylation protein PagP